MPSPTVSVIIPVYNRADLIEETFLSVVRQTYRPIEAILVDDGSTDDSLSTLKALKEKHESDNLGVIVLSQPNRGVARARNHGMERSKGDYVQFLDSDDLYHTHKTEICIEAMRAGDCDLAVPLCRGFVGQEGALLCNTPAQHISDPPQDDLASRFSWSTNGPVLHRRLIDQVGGFPEHIRHGEDQIFFLKARLESKKIVRLPHRLTFFRRAEQNRLSSSSRRYHRRNTRDMLTTLIEKERVIRKARAWNAKEHAHIRSHLPNIIKRLMRHGDLLYLIQKAPVMAKLLANRPL